MQARLHPPLWAALLALAAATGAQGANYDEAVQGDLPAPEPTRLSAVELTLERGINRLDGSSLWSFVGLDDTDALMIVVPPTLTVQSITVTSVLGDGSGLLQQLGWQYRSGGAQDFQFIPTPGTVDLRFTQPMPAADGRFELSLAGFSGELLDPSQARRVHYSVQILTVPELPTPVLLLGGAALLALLGRRSRDDGRMRLTTG